EAGVLYLSVAAVIAFLIPVGVAGQLLGLLLLALQGVAVLFMLSYTHELVDVICRRRWRRPEARPPRLIARAAPPPRTHRQAGRLLQDAEEALPPSSSRDDWDDWDNWTPLVALHVPCHQEPPEVVAKTLRALARLDYPRDAYQVFVVDNNTT